MLRVVVEEGAAVRAAVVAAVVEVVDGGVPSRRSGRVVAVCWGAVGAGGATVVVVVIVVLMLAAVAVVLDAVPVVVAVAVSMGCEFIINYQHNQHNVPIVAWGEIMCPLLISRLINLTGRVCMGKFDACFAVFVHRVRVLCCMFQTIRNFRS